MNERPKHSLIQFPLDERDYITFDYVNYRGEKSRRRVQLIALMYGSNEWHPDVQWFIYGKDVDKNEFRTFAQRDMTDVRRA